MTGVRVAVLGPHPDDFDCIAVTLRAFHRAGAQLSIAVLSGGSSGVDDADADPPTRPHKEALRRAEQRESVRRFGLAETALHFLPLEEDGDGEPAHTEANRARVRACFPQSPDVVFLPHGHDAKGGHRNMYALFRDLVALDQWCPLALLNRDPKTLQIRMDVYTPYDEPDALWKADLLRCHATQQQRNLRSRGTGFDARILAMDRESATRIGCAEPYAEAFEVEDHRPVTSSSKGEAGKPDWFTRLTGGSGNGVHA